MPAQPSSPLTDLARAYGVATDYWDWKGNHVVVSDETIAAVLAALDIDTSTPDAVAKALADKQIEPWRRPLPRVVVLREGWTPWVPVHVSEGTEIAAELELEDGGRRPVPRVEHWIEPREIDGVRVAELTVELPGDLPLGYHRLVVRAGEGAHTAPVIVTPQRLELGESISKDRAWGLTTQLYAVRSARSWGIGDAADLAELGTWAARQGADFVLVNPVHAAEPIPTMEPSPYLPTSRRFVNPMYIRVEEVAEMGYLSAAEHQLIEWHSDDARRLNGLPQLDRDGSWQSKRAALRMLFRAEHTHRRTREFEEFCAREGQALVDFATWCAIAVDRGLPWQEWPPELRMPHSEAVTAERERLADEVEFQCWLQWIVQTQLADADQEMRAAGMRIGTIHDLAVGVHPDGADAWALGDVLAQGISVGAPPDDYNQLGQDWSQPPWRPDRLADSGYAPFRDMIRSLLRMAGGLRVDHIIGLFRLWWLPAGQSPTTGTYVRYDHEALIGILALEAQRAGAVIIGEDLGTVEDWVRSYLTERGILGTSILWFEREGDRPKPPETYRALCLASVTTHDLPPTAGYLQGEHIAVRHELGLLTRPLEEEIAEDDAQRESMLHALRERGLLKQTSTVEEQVDALHRFLTWSPSRLLGVSINDLVGDVRTINQPGTDEEYPNWRLPLADGDHQPLLLDDVMVSRRAKRLIRAVNQRDTR
ncbi:4-alpha-glucanotransferase [Calidifontibacter sp. DB0510]|uniref:4-alpha-glucanotransferase n=1 Tax=Metallococcus carri TaxID=1656884 RepID=A0A967B1X1_9MICO|nr:4-alpha-glucanotransferase [Metallococcus carri]NHN55880.1 4-alpha-glucanotransferase [Metallococcus carri]NOP38432.1 4-alpha-glucanotransferase [Calidifontibacter sp. DB2511S]